MWQETVLLPYTVFVFRKFEANSRLRRCRSDDHLWLQAGRYQWAGVEHLL